VVPGICKLSPPSAGPVWSTWPLKTAFLEACIGETLAAVEVAEAAARATDPAVKSVLSRIAEDETRHAALGFRFVKWALDAMEEPSRRALGAELLAAFEAEFARVTATPATSGVIDETLAAHGVLSPSKRTDLRSATMRYVVSPSVWALLSRCSGAVLAA
jgi:hypothetical protein